jgi:hypothetical protein
VLPGATETHPWVSDGRCPGQQPFRCPGQQGRGPWFSDRPLPRATARRSSPLGRALPRATGVTGNRGQITGWPPTVAPGNSHCVAPGNRVNAPAHGTSVAPGNNEAVAPGNSLEVTGYQATVAPGNSLEVTGWPPDVAPGNSVNSSAVGRALPRATAIALPRATGPLDPIPGPAGWRGRGRPTGANPGRTISSRPPIELDSISDPI